MDINFFPIVKGLASYVLPKSLFRRPGSGGTFSAEYCYSVWLRHLSQLKKAQLINSPSQIVSMAEIGPGDSLGIGISGLFCGAKDYYAFDVIKHANAEKNIDVAYAIAKYFEQRRDIPSGARFEKVSPLLENYGFPDWLIDNADSDFINRRSLEIAKALREEPSEVNIKYIVPWNTRPQIDIKGLDLIFSQAVMEHVDDIDAAYSAMYKWLRPGGIISHQIDYKSHEMTKEWNGHWYINDSLWNVLLHGRKYPINRLPHSAHLNAIKKAGFTVRNVLPVKRQSRLSGSPKVSFGFDNDDFNISSALIQAVK